MKIKSAFAKNVVVLFSGSAIGQILPLALTPLLTRIYSPADIGEFSIFFGFFSTLSSVLSLKMEQAILLPSSASEALRIFRLSFKIVFYVAIVSLLVVLFRWLFGLGGVLEPIKSYWFLLPLQLFLYGYILCSTYYQNRLKKYSIISYSKILQGGAYPVLQCVLNQLKSVGLVLGFMAGTAVSFFYLFWNSRHVRGLLNFKITAFDFALLKRYRSFPLFTTSHSLLNSLSNNFPLLSLGTLFSTEIVAYYAWSNRIIQAPMGFIISSVHQVFYQRIAEYFSSEKPIYPLIKSLLKKLFIIGIIPYSITGVFAPDIFAIVFGSEWRIAGVYTQWMVPWFFLVFLNSPLTSVIQVLNKQKEYFVYEFIILFFRVLAILIGYYLFESPLLSIILFGAVGFVYNVFLFFYIIKISKNQTK